MHPALPTIPAKRYFTIGEVSELCGVKPYVLRYWEQEFAQLRPMKRRGNRRYYQHHEVLLVRRIRELLYEQGFTISGARSRLAAGSKALSGGGASPGTATAGLIGSSTVTEMAARDKACDDDEDEGDADWPMPSDRAAEVDVGAGTTAGTGAVAETAVVSARRLPDPLQPRTAATESTPPAAAAAIPLASDALALVRRELLLIRDVLDTP